MTDKTPAEMLEALGKAFPPAAIKQRKGGGGKSLSYIETHTVIHRLNTATNGWDFHIRGYAWRGDLLIVHGELTIPGLGSRSGFGVQQVVERAGEDLVKGAASDCLKKCATLFGVALDLYGADYENVPVQTPRRPPGAPKPLSPVPIQGSARASAEAVVPAQTRQNPRRAPEPTMEVSEPIEDEDDRVEALRDLLAAANENGYTEDDVDLYFEYAGIDVGTVTVARMEKIAKGIKSNPVAFGETVEKAKAMRELHPTNAELGLE